MIKNNFIIAHSNHFRARVGQIKYIIIHCSTKSPEGILSLCNKLGLSAHYIIGRDGRIIESVVPENVAYHAGVSSWKASLEVSLNEYSIGIELEAPTLGQSVDDYTDIQIDKLCDLLDYLTLEYKIEKHNILGHSDIAPERKPDPGVCFPWKKLYDRGFGIGCTNTDELSDCIDEITLLEIIGYDISNLSAARYSFCRHFFINEIKIYGDIQYLVDNPYPVDFKPNDFDGYMKKLRNVAKNLV